MSESSECDQVGKPCLLAGSRVSPFALVIRRVWSHVWRWLGLAWLPFMLSSLLAAPAFATDDPPGRVGRIAQVLGNGWFLDDEQSEWNPAWLNQPITRGDRLRVEPDSRLVVQVGSSSLRLDGGSEVLFSRLDDDQVAVRVVRGKVALRIRQPEVVREWGLDSQDGSLLPLSPGFFRLDVDGRGTSGVVLYGEVRLEDGNRQGVVMRRGQQVSLLPVDRNRWELRWAGLADDEFDRWLRREDDAEMAWQNRDGLSTEMTGVTELDRYGRWDRHPEFGMVWYPAAVSVDWVPFRQGRWIWSARWGWTWLDEAPWGFATSHYGRWTHWGGRWCWVPGAYERRPVFAPALVAWVGSSGSGVNVSIGAPPVAWVPLAPREIYRPPHREVSVEWLLRANGPHLEPHRRHDREYFQRDREPPRHWANGDRGVTMVPGQHFERKWEPQPVRPMPPEPGRRGGPDWNNTWRAVEPPAVPGREPRREVPREPGREFSRDAGRDTGREVGRDTGRDGGRDGGRDIPRFGSGEPSRPADRPDQPGFGGNPRNLPVNPVVPAVPNAPVFQPPAAQAPQNDRSTERSNREERTFGGPGMRRVEPGTWPPQRSPERSADAPADSPTPRTFGSNAPQMPQAPQMPAMQSAPARQEREAERPVLRGFGQPEQRNVERPFERQVERPVERPPERQFERPLERQDNTRMIQPGAPKLGPVPVPAPAQQPREAPREPAREQAKDNPRDHGRSRDNRQEQR